MKNSLRVGTNLASSMKSVVLKLVLQRRIPRSRSCSNFPKLNWMFSSRARTGTCGSFWDVGPFTFIHFFFYSLLRSIKKKSCVWGSFSERNELQHALIRHSARKRGLSFNPGFAPTWTSYFPFRGLSHFLGINGFGARDPTPPEFCVCLNARLGSQLGGAKKCSLTSHGSPFHLKILLSLTNLERCLLIPIQYTRDTWVQMRTRGSSNPKKAVRWGRLCSKAGSFCKCSRYTLWHRFLLLSLFIL